MKQKLSLEHLKKEFNKIADIAVGLHGWDEAQQDINAKMIGFETRIDSFRFRANVYVSKMTIMVQSQYYGREIIIRNASDNDIERVFSNPKALIEFGSRNKQKQKLSEVEELRLENKLLRAEIERLKSIAYSAKTPRIK